MDGWMEEATPCRYERKKTPCREYIQQNEEIQKSNRFIRTHMTHTHTHIEHTIALYCTYTGIVPTKFDSSGSTLNT